MTGTCQIQILRSCSPWSIGYANNKVEHSIMNAYCHLIRNSEHFVYGVKQYLVSSLIRNCSSTNAQLVGLSLRIFVLLHLVLPVFLLSLPCPCPLPPEYMSSGGVAFGRV